MAEQQQQQQTFDEFLRHLAVPDLMGKQPLDYVLHSGAVSIPSEGLMLEFGVFSGNSITKIAQRFPDRRVFGFDSFEGLPEDWGRPDMAFGKGAFDLGGRLPPVPENVTLVPGWFDQTLPRFEASLAPDRKIALMHVDCDIYSSTKAIFGTLGHRLTHGSVIVFDELFNYPTYEKHEILALYEDIVLPGRLGIRWIGKNGPLLLNPSRDNGAWDQPAALQLVQLA